MGRLFAAFFFLSVSFAGIHLHINMFEAVRMLAETVPDFQVPVHAAVRRYYLSGGSISGGGESRTGKWLDTVSIAIVPLEPSWEPCRFYVLGYPKILEELGKGT